MPDEAHIGDYAGGCRGIDPPLSNAGLDMVMVIRGYQVAATPGMLSCGEAAEDAVTCIAEGPGRIHVHPENAEGEVGFELDEGQVGRFSIDSTGANCNIRAER